MRRASFGLLAYVYGFALLALGFTAAHAWSRDNMTGVAMCALSSTLFLRRLADGHDA